MRHVPLTIFAHALPFSFRTQRQQCLTLCVCVPGWSGGVGSDWTAMDPAIVSSGQLAGPPRSDSPPHWLRSLEQLTETGPMYPPAGPPQRAAQTLWTSTPPPGFNPAL